MAKDTCLGCSAPFPANKQLASVPLARLVAFDPDANRVWRICEPCGHWNLLGPEAAQAAMPELIARSNAGVSAGSAGLALVDTGTHALLIFRVGAVTTRDAVALKATEIRASMADGHHLTWEQGKYLLGGLIVGGASLWALNQFETTAKILASDAVRSLWLSFMVVRMSVAGREILRSNSTLLRWFWILAVPSLLIDWYYSTEPLWLLVATGAVGAGLGLKLGKQEGAPRGIRWSDGTDEISYHDGVLGDHTGWSATTLAVHELANDFAERVKLEDRDAAWELWQAHASLASLLTAFEARRDATGLLRFSAMELRERLALLIAVGARLAEPPAEVVAGLSEAERIAAIAESLDLAEGRA